MLKVRGAPAIGIAGAYGLVVSVKKYINEPVDKFITEIIKNNVEEAQIIIYGGEPLTNFELLQKIIQYIN